MLKLATVNFVIRRHLLQNEQEPKNGPDDDDDGGDDDDASNDEGHHHHRHNHHDHRHHHRDLTNCIIIFIIAITITIVKTIIILAIIVPRDGKVLKCGERLSLFEPRQLSRGSCLGCSGSEVYVNEVHSCALSAQPSNRVVSPSHPNRPTLSDVARDRLAFDAQHAVTDLQYAK